jgi:DNA-binding NarL/FixJ family response regulator
MSEQTADRGPAVIRVAIIEDRTEIRLGLKILINGSPGYRSAADFRSMEEALQKAWSEVPEVALVDIGLPGLTGIEGTRLLKERYPEIQVLILTVYDDDERIFEAICAGACGYLLKTTPPARLLEALKEAVTGGAPMSPEVARRVVTLFREFRPPEKAAYYLTPHEVRLLKLFVEGHNNHTAATELGVSVNTIRFHLRSVYEKLQVHSKSEAVAKALRNGIVRW